MTTENQQNKPKVQILLPLPLSGAFTYACDSARLPALGAFVEVPFGKKTLCGVVWGVNAETPDGLDDSKIRPITKILDFPVLNDAARKLISWTAGYTMFPEGAVLKLCLTSPDLLKTKENAVYTTPADAPSARLTPARKKVLGIDFSTPLAASEIAARAAVSAGVVSEMVKAGLLKRAAQAPADSPLKAAYAFHGAALNNEQTAAAEILESAVGNGFQTFVLKGVTGSGKTEVYFKAVDAALKAGKQVLVLLPEIGLTTQWTSRFEKRFGAKPALWHSDLTPALRRDTWQGVLKNDVKVIAGARSALFLPFTDLGLIIVDEEHDSSYKQEEGVTYHARNMAVVRGKIENIPVILSSATPSLETVVNAESGRYRPVVLKNRYNDAVLPAVTLVDMRTNPPVDFEDAKSFLSPVLIDAVRENLERKEQSLLFLNRRGYAPLVLCRACGHRFQCPYCAAWLVEHKNGGRLMCHHCGYTVKKPTACPVCAEEDSLTSCGPGAERIYEEAVRRFPDARTLLITSDSAVSPAAFGAMVSKIENNEADIIVATQMLAKGYHFPHLTLVGIADADLGLQGGDLRAGEKTFQLLQQVAGRSGRENKAGRVLMQTFDSENNVIQALAKNDFTAFLQEEKLSRKELSMPPFGKMAALIVSSCDKVKAEQTAMMLGKSAPYGKTVRVLGPAPAPLALLRGKYRYRLLLQTGADVSLQNVIHSWLGALNIPAAVQVKVDIDPYSFF